MKKITFVSGLIFVCLTFFGCSYFGASGAVRGFIDAAEKRDFDYMIDALEDKNFGKGSNYSKEEKQKKLADANFVQKASAGVSSMEIAEKVEINEIKIIEARVFFKNDTDETQIFEMKKNNGAWKIYAWFNKKEYCKTPHPACE